MQGGVTKPCIGSDSFKSNDMFDVFDMTKQMKHVAALPIRLELMFPATLNTR